MLRRQIFRWSALAPLSGQGLYGVIFSRSLAAANRDILCHPHAFEASPVLPDPNLLVLRVRRCALTGQLEDDGPLPFLPSRLERASRMGWEPIAEQAVAQLRAGKGVPEALAALSQVRSCASPDQIA